MSSATSRGIKYYVANFGSKLLYGGFVFVQQKKFLKGIYEKQKFWRDRAALSSWEGISSSRPFHQHTGTLWWPRSDCKDLGLTSAVLPPADSSSTTSVRRSSPRTRHRFWSRLPAPSLQQLTEAVRVPFKVLVLAYCVANGSGSTLTCTDCTLAIKNNLFIISKCSTIICSVYLMKSMSLIDSWNFCFLSTWFNALNGSRLGWKR